VRAAVAGARRQGPPGEGGRGITRDQRTDRGGNGGGSTSVRGGEAASASVRSAG
jgi:hypothetical protein